MKSLVTVLVVLLAILVPSVALACDKGGVLMGPNCIHVEAWEVSASAGHAGPLYKSTAYRVVGSAKWVLWSEIGEVVESTKFIIRTTTRFEYDDGTVNVISETYHCNGGRYR
jgi:hypothetical protein